jgi:hypothetical protein
MVLVGVPPTEHHVRTIRIRLDDNLAPDEELENPSRTVEGSGADSGSLFSTYAELVNHACVNVSDRHMRTIPLNAASESAAPIQCDCFAKQFDSHSALIAPPQRDQSIRA